MIIPFNFRDLADAALTLTLICTLCGLPLFSIAFIIYGAVVTQRQFRAGERLAPELGLQVQTPGSHPTRTWYLGRHRGRAYLLRTYARSSAGYHEGRRRRSVSSSLQLIMPIRSGTPLEVRARLGPRKLGRRSYDDTFVGLGVERLNPAGGQALYALAKKGHPTGLKKSGRLQLSRGWRNVRIATRAELEKEMGPDVAAQSLPEGDGYLLALDPDAGLSADGVRALLDDMGEVVRTIETGRPSDRLDPDQIAGEGFIGRHANRIMIGLFVIVFPAVMCCCITAAIALAGG